VRAAAVVLRDGQVLLARRPSSGLLGGLWEFPNAPVEGEPALELAPAIEAAYHLTVQPGPPLGIIRHAYTHFRVIMHAFLCEVDSIADGLTWVDVALLPQYPMGKVDRQIGRAIPNQETHLLRPEALHLRG
jgi:A/G-specific adenine glycosylase